MRPIAVVVAAVLALGLLAGPAHARSTVVLRSEDAVGAPDLAGEEIVYGVGRTRGRTPVVDVRAAVAGRPARRLRTLVLESDEDAWEAVAAPGALVAATATVAAPGTERVTRAGPLGGPDVELLRCRRPPALGYGRPDADGTRVAVVGAGCAPDRILVTDVAGGGSDRVVQAPGPVVNPVALAGRYLAFVAEVARASSRLVIVDLDTGAAVHEANTGGAVDLDVQDDGTALVNRVPDRPSSRRACQLATLERHAPGRPVARPVTGPVCLGRVRVAEGRLAFARPAGTSTQVALADLAGGAVRPVASRYESSRRAVVEDFDWDGRRVAWSAPGCTEAAILSVRDADDTSPADPARRCPLRVDSRSLRLARDGTLTLRVRCPLGCRGSVDVRGPRFVRFGLDRRRGSTFRAARGASVAVRLRLRPRSAARARRLGRVRLRLSVLHAFGPTRVTRTLRAA